MVRLTKFLAVLIAAVILSSFTVFAADSYISLNGFVFSINSDGNAVIHDYDGDPGELVIPEKLLGAKVSAIDDYAFFGNTGITSVDFGNAVYLKSIGADAFFGCAGLNTIKIPESVEALGFGAFQNCTGLKSAIVYAAVTDIPSQCFKDCTSLESVYFASPIETVGAFAFAGCAFLGDVIMPASVTSISDNAFEGACDVVIFCPEGSYAESFANDNGIEVKELLESYSLGDANLDGRININDVTYIQKCIAGIVKHIPHLSGVYGDTNRDEGISVRDATILQMYLAEIIPEL